MQWDRTTFDADGLTGERLQLRSNARGNLATVVVWPGRATRLYWPGGHHVDYHGRDSRSVAVREAEGLAGRSVAWLAEHGETE